MKRMFGLAGLLWLSLLGMPSVEAQTAGGYPVSIYGLTLEQSVPGNLPADDATGWVDLKLPAVTTEKPWDTVNRTFLSPDAAPVPFSGNTKMDVTLYPIGFDFHYSGRTMTHFGLTGHGLIYLGAQTESDQEAVTRNINYVTYNTPTNLRDVIFAAPRFINTFFVPSTVVDNQTAIRYYVDKTDAANPYLVIRYKDVLMQHTRLVPQKDPVLYNVRWNSEVILHADGRVQCRVISSDIPEKDPAWDYPALYFGYGLYGGEGEAEYVHIADWAGNLTRTKSAIKCVVAEDAANFSKVLTFTPPAPCTAPASIEAEAAFQNVTSNSMAVRDLALKSGTCDGWLVLLTEHNDAGALTRPADGTVYTKEEALGNLPVRTVGVPASANWFNASGLKQNQRYYVCVFPYNDACSGGPVYGQPYFIETPKTEQIPQLLRAETTETSARFTLTDDWPADAEILVGIAERDYGPEDVSAAPKSAGMTIQGPYEKGDVLYEDAAADQDLKNGNHGPYKITAAYVGKLTDRSLTLSDLTPDKPYYFYFWKRAETIDPESYTYVSEYTHAGIRTVGTVGMKPLTFSFATDRASENAYNKPAGWTSEHLTELYNAGTGVGLYDLNKEATDSDEKRAWGMNLYSPGQAEPVSADFISPWFKTENADIDVYYYINLQSYWASTENQKANLQKQLAPGDTLTIDYRVEGETAWTPLFILSEFDADLVYGADNLTALKTTVKGLAVDKPVQLRMMLRATEPETRDWRLSETVVLHHLYIEPAVVCASADDLEIIDSLTTYRTLALSFTDKNLLSSSVYSYRIEGEETWSAPEVSLERRRLLVRGLQPQKTYEVALRLVCADGDTSVMRTVKGKTLNGLPYDEALHHIETVPTGIKLGYGDLPADKQEPARITPTGSVDHIGFGLRTNGDDYKTMGVSFNLPTGAWLTTEAICLEDEPLPAAFTFFYRAQRLLTAGEITEGGAEVGEVDAGSAFRVMALVSTDGSFRRADSVGVLAVQDFKMTRQAFTIDLSAYKGRVYIALYAENPDVKAADFDQNAAGRNIFIVDSLDARFTADQPCDPVTDIFQSDITYEGITLSWNGYALSYGIRLVNLDTEEERMVYTDRTTYTFDDLTQGTRYIYYIQGYCGEEHSHPSAWSEENFFMTTTLCPPPTGFEVLETTWQSVRISAISGVNDKVMRIWSKDNNPPLEYTLAWNYGELKDTVKWSGLYDRLNTTYYVSVRTVCSVGDSSDWLEPIEFKTKPAVCGMPTNLACTYQAPTYVQLNWEAGENNEYFILSYRPVKTSKFDSTFVDKTPYRLVGLSPNTAYVWQVRGVYDELLSQAASGPNFSTAGTAVESVSRFAGLRVEADHGRIAIYNTDGLPLDRVEVYGMNGQRLYAEAFGGTDNHLILPVLDENAHLVLVRIFSGGEMATYKVMLL